MYINTVNSSFVCSSACIVIYFLCEINEKTVEQIMKYFPRFAAYFGENQWANVCKLKSLFKNVTLC